MPIIIKRKKSKATKPTTANEVISKHLSTIVAHMAVEKILTEEQNAILAKVDWLIEQVQTGKVLFKELYKVLEVFQIEALAGTGKTFMFEQIITKIVKAFPYARILVLSFTNKAVDEIRDRLTKYLPENHNVVFSTVSAFGGRLIKQKYDKISYDADGGVEHHYDEIKKIASVEAQVKATKSKGAWREYYNSDAGKKAERRKKSKQKIYWIMYNNHIGMNCTFTDLGEEKWRFRYSSITKWYDKIIDLYKNYNLAENDTAGAVKILEEHGFRFDEELISETLTILELSRENHLTPKTTKRGKMYYDFAFTMSDLFDIPLVEKIVPTDKFDFIFVDEFQDCNLAQVRLIKQISKESVTFVVGDRNQAIFYHAGAVGNSFEIMTFDKMLIASFTLSTNFRCSQAVVKDANEIIPNLKARADAPEGAVNRNKTIDYVVANCTNEDVIVSYTNNELFNLSIEFIRNNKKCYIKGADFDELMQPIYKAIKAGRKTVDGIEGFYRSLIREKIDYLSFTKYKFNELDAENDWQVKELKTTLKQITVLINQFNFVSKRKVKLMDFIDSIKEYIVDDIKKADIQLSTYHKTKGGEWRKVYIHNVGILNTDWMNQTKKAQLQNSNLLYVIRTRAKIETVYFEADMEAIQAANENQEN